MLGGTGGYVSYRLYQGLAAFFPGIRLWQVLAVAGLFLLLMILDVLQAFTVFPTGLKHAFQLFSGCFMGIFIYLFLFTAAADILLIAPKLLKLPFTAHHLFRGCVTIAVVLFTVITCVYGFANARQIDHAHYDIGLEGKKDISDIKVVMISDVHLGAAGSESRMKDIVEEINALEPDIVCISGDFFDTDFRSILDPDAAIETLRGLRSTYGTYACLGNHDGGSTFGQMEDFLEKADIRLLKDEFTVIDDRFVLAGRLDRSPIGGYGNEKRKPLSEYLTVDDPTLPVIVLDHNPQGIEEYGSEADLVLCGHTHKGQIFPGRLFTSRIYTVDYGYYRKDAQSPHVIVSSGVGYWGMPMRVGTDSEIVSVSFTSQE